MDARTTVLRRPWRSGITLKRDSPRTMETLGRTMATTAPDNLMIPAGPEEVTPAWLTSALREGGVLPGRQSIVSFDATLLSEGVGFIGIVARVLLKYNGDPDAAPITLIAKFPSPDPGARQIGQMYGLYEREVRFYRDLRDDVGVRTPRCYYSAMDVDNGRYVLLLEDLAALGTIGDQVAGCSSEHAMLAVDELAKLHGTLWCSPRLDELSWLQRGSDIVRAALEQVYPHVFPLT